MFDCGEGVQRQMIRAKTGFHKKMKILITHMHGDHLLGLPGVLQTMALLNRERKVDVYGPEGIGGFFDCIKETVQFGLTFPVEIHEIKEAGEFCNEEEYVLEAVYANHLVPALAYCFQEKTRPGRFSSEKALALGVPEGPLWGRLQKGMQVETPEGRIVEPEQVLGKCRQGRKIVYTGDTSPFKELVDFSSKANLLIHDSTLDDELLERAKEDGHSTPTQAAQIARKAHVHKLILTHISARYGDAEKLIKQAKKTFMNVEVAEDLMKTEIPLSD